MKAIHAFPSFFFCAALLSSVAFAAEELPSLPLQRQAAEASKNTFTDIQTAGGTLRLTENHEEGGVIGYRTLSILKTHSTLVENDYVDVRHRFAFPGGEFLLVESRCGGNGSHCAVSEWHIFQATEKGITPVGTPFISESTPSVSFADGTLHFTAHRTQNGAALSRTLVVDRSGRILQDSESIKEPVEVVVKDFSDLTQKPPLHSALDFTPVKTSLEGMGAFNEIHTALKNFTQPIGAHYSDRVKKDVLEVFYNGSNADESRLLFLKVWKDGYYFILLPDPQAPTDAKRTDLLLYTNLPNEAFTTTLLIARRELHLSDQSVWINNERLPAFPQHLPSFTSAKSRLIGLINRELSRPEAIEHIAEDQIKKYRLNGARADILRRHFRELLTPHMIRIFAQELANDKGLLAAFRANSEHFDPLAAKVNIGVGNFLQKLNERGSYLVNTKDKRVLLQQTFTTLSALPERLCGELITGSRPDAQRESAPFINTLYARLSPEEMRDFLAAGRHAVFKAVYGSDPVPQLSAAQKTRALGELQRNFRALLDGLTLEQRSEVLGVLNGAKMPAPEAVCMTRKLEIESVLRSKGEVGDWATELFYNP